MKTLQYSEDWPETWKYSYPYDCLEVFGALERPGYRLAYSARRDATFRLIAEAAPPGARILDVAAAQGNFSLALAEMGYDVTWNDLRAELEEYVRLKHERGRLTFAPGNVFDLHFPELFDCVLITEIIEHVAHPDEFLRKIANLVRPGGAIVMTTPNGGYFMNRLPSFSDCEDPSQFENCQFQPNGDGHIFLLWEHEIRSLADAAGLVTDKIIFTTNPLTAGHLKLEPLLKFLPRSTVSLIENFSRTMPHHFKQRLCTHLAARFTRSADKPNVKQSGNL
jgi:2-polyprenyl-6-hydroxyphenyl methylase/3-demethylubiquinone-9 3-methyltransferase